MYGGADMLCLDQVEIAQGAFRLTADFELPLGRKTALIGPSGAGKSTLLGALSGFVPLAQGRITFEGHDITRARPDARAMAMLFQDGNLFPHLTLAQNVGLGVRPTLRLSADEQAQVTAALARVGLDGLEGRKPGELSGGQQSRAALARVLVMNKPIILLDEPFAALGPALRIEMIDLVGEVASQIAVTVLMVTHAPEDVVRFADDVIFVSEGMAQSPVAAGPAMQDPPPDLAGYLGRAV